MVTQQLIIAADIYVQLSKLNYDGTSICNTSHDALEQIKKNRPDVVLVDLSLKGSIDGLQLGKILAKNHRVPVIYLNPGMDQETINSAAAQNPKSFINIPYEVNDLKRKIIKASAKSESPFLSKVALC